MSGFSPALAAIRPIHNLAPPAFVRDAGGGGVSNTTTLTVTFSAPTSGNLLVGVCCAVNTGITPTVPSGWTAAGRWNSTLGNSSDVNLLVCIKVSDGTETSAAFTRSNNGYMTARITEWSGATIGTVSSGGTNSLAPSPAAFGPSNSPANSSAIPFMACGFRGNPLSVTPSTGWSGTFVTTNSFAGSGYLYQTPPPGAATSGTVGFTGANCATYPFGWINVWLEP